MKKIFLLTTFLSALSFASVAQINYGASYDPHFNTIGSRYFPSRLGATFEQGEVNFINVYGWVSNNAVGYKYIKSMVFGDQINTDQVNAIVGQLKNNNNVFVGADVQIFNAAFKVKSKKDKEELFTLELGHRERVMGNLQFSKNFMKLALEGNKQFANENVTLSKMRVNAVYSREFYIGVAVPITVKLLGHELAMRAMARGKFLMGIANVFTKKGNAEMFTEQDGRYIDFNYDYKFSHSIPNEAAALGKGSGYGGAVDFGLGVVLDDKLCLDLGVVDLGGIKFTKNTHTYQRSGLYHYDGVELFLKEENNKPTVGFQIDEKVLDPEKSEEAYNTPYGTKLTLRAEYRMVEGEAGKKYKRTYYQHHVYLTYVQGFDNTYSASKLPNFSLGYMYSLKDILNLGLSVGFGGYNKFSVGPFLSVKGGPFVIGFGSNNLMAFIAPKVGTGADGYFNIGFNF